MNTYNVDEVYEIFWKSIIEDDDGNINKEQLKAELADFYVMIQEVPKVYSEVTGGVLSKPLWSAEHVLSYFNERFGDKARAVDYLVDDWDSVTEECRTNEDYRIALFEYFYLEENNQL